MLSSTHIAAHAPISAGPTPCIRLQGAHKHTVRPGDTVYEIAAEYHVSVELLVHKNGLTDGGRWIYPGQTLHIVDNSDNSDNSDNTKHTSSNQLAASDPSAKNSSNVRTITVHPGDTLSGIAAQHGVSVAAVLELNPGIRPEALWVDSTVRLPSTSTEPQDSHATSPRETPYTQDNIGDYLNDTDVDDTFLHYTYSSAVARSATANRDYLSAAPVPSRSQTKSLIVDTARRHGVDSKLMLALSYQESGWNQRAVSPANAIGVMQVIPTSGEWASALVGRPLNLLDPHDNITAGVVIMRALQRSADTGDEAIGGYYQGLSSVNQYGLFSDTRDYVASITSLRSKM